MRPSDDTSSEAADDPPARTDEDLAFLRERDAEENRESSLPPGEGIRIVSFTCVEIYTPSTIDKLIAGLAALGWERPDTFNPSIPNLVDWIRSTRANPFGGAWINLGRITNEDSPPPLGGSLQAKLPDGVVAIWGELHSTTPSITCLVMQFVLDEETSRTLEHIFETEFATRTERVHSGWRYFGPMQQRMDQVRTERQRLRSICHRWISERLPGVFSSGVATAGMPTVETFVCDLAKPFDRQDYKGFNDYRVALDIDNDSDAYESPQLAGWRLSAWGARAPDEPFVLRLGARWTDVNDDELSKYGSSIYSALASRLTHPLFAFSTRFALHCLCRGYEEHLSDIRDRIASVRRHGGDVEDRDVETLYQLVTDTSYDARVVAFEMSEFCSNERRFRHVGADFSPVANWRREYEPSLVELLRNSTLSRAESIVPSEATARDSISNLASVMTSTINLRVGRAVFRLTWIAVVAGILALVVAIIALFLA
jgi:hypothetical protein